MSTFEASPNKQEVVFENMLFWTTRYLQPASNEPAGPQSFLQEQSPGSILRAHFHRANQFQVVVKGRGKLGKHDVAPISIHYTDGDTPYGPLIASDEGLAYFTLRSQHENDAYFMPESRKEREKTGKKRSLLADPIRLSLQFKENDTVELQRVLKKHEDGMCADFIRVPPNLVYEWQNPRDGGGQFYLIVNGTMILENNELPLWSNAFVFPDDEPIKIQSGQKGLEVLALQFPQ